EVAMPSTPEKYEGYMLKKKKWPLKGWHKRFFVLAEGFLKYAKTPHAISKEKVHGVMDMGLSVMSTKKNALTIDLDAADVIFHLKVKSPTIYQLWISRMRCHRDFRQQILKRDSTLNFRSFNTSIDANRNTSIDAKVSIFFGKKIFISLLQHPQVFYLNRITNILFFLHIYILSFLTLNIMCILTYIYSKSKKSMKKVQKQTAKMATVESSSAISSLSDVGQLQSDNFKVISFVFSHLHEVNNVSPASLPSFKPLNVTNQLTTDYSPQDACEGFGKLHAVHSQLEQKTNELQARLKRIHQESADTPLRTSRINEVDFTKRPMLGKLLSESQLSISDTADLFYDAEEYFLSDEESSSDEEVCDGDDVSSETELSDTEAPGKLHRFIGLSCFSLWYVAGVRRSRLPCPAPVSDVSLWNILKKNIGKDLSKVAMPVTLNEPLNALQLLCEELEYSELLDDAARSDDKFERMLLVATFAVSGYCSTYHRAGQKPFNPILGETYEHIRDNKNLRFVAEQVSHHPPISACHCTGEGFEYWRDVRFKNKFWGKSMEVFPVGSVHVKLKGCEYEWKKVTSCVHNIVAGTRWVEHYGDMLISSEDVICKISFSKSGYWSSKHGEISGAVMNAQGEVVHKLHGKWFEGVFCETAGHTRCLWRAESMPPDFEQYYGFSKFAIELNELTNLDRKYLPHTDTRHRPDQRLLELGDVDSAEAEKQRVEQIQRDHKRLRDENNIDYHPRFFKKVLVGASERWQYTGNYWQARKDPGFQEFLQDITPLW
uniref:Oxysterol-binding protein n=1 Tax=Ciona savignyi TaxID=51511 RepID=H2YR78_CIOSA